MATLQQIQELVAEVRQKTNNSSIEFPELFNTGEPKYPIPFFGNLLKAQIFAVGLNPSKDEFNNREWQNGFSNEILTNRLYNYFSHPHQWFEKWNEVLCELDDAPCYAEGHVAHLDISPRATLSFSSFNEVQAEQFKIMLQRDIAWLFQILAKFVNPKLILVAGTASETEYLDDLISKYAGSYAFKLTSRMNVHGIKCRRWKLEGHGKSMPVFFSGSSPSNRKNPERLLENVRMNTDLLNGFLI
jgi:uracil-DNA glycosylase